MLNGVSVLHSNTTDTQQRAQNLLVFIHNLTEKINGNKSSINTIQTEILI